MREIETKEQSPFSICARQFAPLEPTIIGPLLRRSQGYGIRHADTSSDVGYE